MTLWWIDGDGAPEPDPEKPRGEVSLRQFSKVPDLSGIRSVESLGRIVHKAYPGFPTEYRKGVRDGLWAFLNGISDSDLIAVRTRGYTGVRLGRVTGGYEFSLDEVNRSRHSRAVVWYGEFKATVFPEDLLLAMRTHDKIIKLSGATESRAEDLRKQLISNPEGIDLTTDPALFGFDLEDYSHLNEETTKAQWIAEFLSRNESFRRDYLEWERSGHGQERRQGLRLKYGVDVRRGWNPDARPGDCTLTIELPGPVTAFRIVPPSERAVEKSLRASQQSLLKKLEGQGAESKTAKQLWKDILNLQFAGPDVPPKAIISKLTGVNILNRSTAQVPDLLLLSIRMDRLMEKEIIPALNRVLELHKKTRSANSIDPAYAKQQLMVYDLATRHGASRAQIGRVLLSLLRNSRFERPGYVSKQLHDVKELIEGGYKKYF